MNVIIRAILMWLLFIPVPIINGLFREKYYKVKIGDKISHQVGVGILSVFFVLYGYLFFNKIIYDYSGEYLFMIGLLWVVLTMAFEFILGLKNKLSWGQMLKQYDLAQGNLWPLFLLVELFCLVLVRLIII